MFKLYLLAVLAASAVRSESITAIGMRTGFRSCVGYCYKSIYINSTTTRTSEVNQLNSTSYPEIVNEYATGPTLFEQLVTLVGSIQLWKTVDTPIGCPDCQNQGFRWVDVYTDEQPMFGAQFEYNSTITNYESLVTRLRAIYQQYFPPSPSSS